MTNVVVKVEHLTKRFGTYVAVDDISFEAREGEVFGILGSNGAGKTTTMKMICGLLAPSSGRILFRGRDVMTHKRYVKGRMGFLPETPNLYESITGYEFLDLMGTLRGIGKEELEGRIAHLAEVMELKEQINDQLGTYSKGMRQKIAFAAATIHDPKVLVLDEPTSGLDPRFGRYFKTWIRQNATRGRCVIMSTHFTLIAEEICDRVAVMNKSRIIGTGTIAELKEAHGVDSLEKAFMAIVGGRKWDQVPSLR